MNLSWDDKTTLENCINSNRVYTGCGITEKRADAIITMLLDAYDRFPSIALCLKAFSEIIEEPNEYAFACYTLGKIRGKDEMKKQLSEGANELLTELTK